MADLYYFHRDIVFQEVPNETSLMFYMSGCPLKCNGCHSPEGWNKFFGNPLLDDEYSHILSEYHGLITCVLFMGGEWNEKELIPKLATAKEHGFKTCLYTGLDWNNVSSSLALHLDYIKVGAWKQELGGLESPTTNQHFYELQSGVIVQDITYKFKRKVSKHA